LEAIAAFVQVKHRAIVASATYEHSFQGLIDTE
jgi:hypothetical protein